LHVIVGQNKIAKSFGKLLLASFKTIEWNLLLFSYMGHLKNREMYWSGLTICFHLIDAYRVSGLSAQISALNTNADLNISMLKGLSWRLMRVYLFVFCLFVFFPGVIVSTQLS